MTGALPGDAVARAWTIIGTVASPRRAIVDQRGMVTATPSGWSLDWWIGADDRWHLPATEASVRQHLVGDAPVVETAMHIPGGDAVHRAYAIHDRDGDDPGGDGRELVVIEIENLSPVPFAVALAVRPLNPLGPAPVDAVELDGTTLVVNGRPGVLLPKVPSRAAARAGAAGDVIECVLAGEAPVSMAPTRCTDHRATAAVIYPLPHTAVLRVALPIDDGRPRLVPTRASGLARSTRSDRAPTAGSNAAPTPTAGPVGAVPSAGQVAKGWEAQTRRGLQAAVPDARLGAAIDASRRFLLLAHGGDRMAGWPEPVRPTDWTEAAPVLAALDRWGFGAEAGEVLASLADAGPRGVDAAALVALGEHWQLTHDRALLDDLDGVIASGVAASAGRRRSGRPIPERDGRARVDGLRAAAMLLAAMDQPAAARDVAGRADALARRLDTAVATSAAPTVEGPAVVDAAGRGLSPRLTLALALDEVTAGDRAALDRLAWAAGVASPTHVWPEVVDDRGRASAGAGHDLVAGALFLSLVRALLIREIRSEHGPGLALCSMLDREWRGQNFEVHDAPTAHGLVSYAVRWHGERPALLWELEPWDGSDPAVALVAPGLDPAWTTTDRRGEALLAAGAAGVTQSTGLDRPERGASFS